MEPNSIRKETHMTRSDNHAAKRVVGVIFGIIEIILAFRLVFKLLGANPDNGFVKAIYNITQFFVGIFEGIFGKVDVVGAQSVFEPATLIAMIVVAIAAWIILKLMTPRDSSHVDRVETVDRSDSTDDRLQK